MWEVLGFEKSVSAENGFVTGVTLHCAKPCKSENGGGQKVKSFWYRPASIAYDPVVGDRVIIDVDVRGQYQIVTDIQVY